MPGAKLPEVPSCRHFVGGSKILPVGRGLAPAETVGRDDPGAQHFPGVSKGAAAPFGRPGKGIFKGDNPFRERVSPLNASFPSAFLADEKSGAAGGKNRNGAFPHTRRGKNKKEGDPKISGLPLLRFDDYHTTPCASMAFATFRKPATFAPTTMLPG